MHSNNIASHRSTSTWARSGETEFAISHFLAGFEVRAKGETKFSLQLETLDVCIAIFLYSTCKPQARRTPSTPAIRCGGQAPVELTLKPALYSSSSQIHADSSSTTHTGTGRRSRPGIGFTCFPQTARLVSHPSKPRAVVVRGSSSWIAISTTWQLVVLVPRSTDTHVAKHMAISRNGGL